ncbi:MAG: 1-(5-phosphoribosyl)-5-[(5-phosphoribosylamino)methylideneamino]imidazole-4-carboxamide isomerase [Ginsengibacter sp.]
MQIIPAIDIIGGKCVRLTKGDYSKEVVYYEQPVDAAKAFEDAGFERLHIVDLDGAKSRTIQNLQVLQAVASHTRLIIDFGGGVTSIEDVSNVLNAGASIVTLGSIVVQHPGIVEEWFMEFGVEKFLMGADVLDRKIKISGWTQDGGMNILEFMGKILALGATRVFCTDISKDGMLKGPAFDLYKEIMAEFPAIGLIASGGVQDVADVIELKKIGCKGVIIGKAIYEGKISLSQLSKLNSDN